ncbi:MULTISPECIES: hypothetical protein [Metabacillus]|uniref:Uncharacterized protein n=1 Tax=Metabacillus rhizolycopersici TaxID=2875709 RepID=A0ABS7ULM6_9BACI|nr:MULTISPECIES: hypothetical protein [Metabacillus]MBZ5748764.1 hypothetical protein [Metabacillus rhizolycopersici]MCM3652802.1 hypothetical protein [Metabacillus litoralis]
MKFSWSLVYCYHFILWSGYSIVRWLSNKDSLMAKSILLILFFYLSYLLAFTQLKTRKRAIIISLCSLLLFALGQQLFRLFFYPILNW